MVKVRKVKVFETKDGRQYNERRYAVAHEKKEEQIEAMIGLLQGLYYHGMPTHQLAEELVNRRGLVLAHLK